MPHLDRRAVIATDVVLAAGLVALSLYALTQPWDDGFRTHSGWLDVVAVTAMTAPFALRTLAPGRALTTIVVGQLVVGLIGSHTLLFYSGLVPLLAIVYAVARRHGGWAARAALLSIPLLVLSDAREPEDRALDNLVFCLVLVGSAWLAGRLVRRLATRSAALEVALTRLELEREAGERDAVELERSRIAAEMHDVIGHALSLMVLQTGAARVELTAAGDAPADITAQLRAAETAGRSALEDLRRTLGLLRGVPLPTQPDTSPR